MNLELAQTTKEAEIIETALRPLLADVFVFYVKTRNLHWYLSKRNPDDDTRLLDQHSDEVLALTNAIAERARAIGGSIHRSVADIVGTEKPNDDYDAWFVEEHRWSALRSDNRRLAELLRFAHRICEEQNDTTVLSIIENWIHETESRNWLLFSGSRVPDSF